MRRLSIVLGIFLLVVGLVFIFNKPIMTYIVSHMTETTLEQNNVAKAKEADDVTFDFEQVEDIDLQGVLKARMNAGDVHSIGAVSVPSVEVQLPILYGVSNVNLAIGAGTMKEEQIMGKGNYALAGHNIRDGKTLFSPLERVKVGDKIYMTDYDMAYEYETDEVFIVTPDRGDVIHDDGSRKMLTLVTCSEKGTKRRIIQAKFVKSIPLNDVPDKIFNLKKDEK